MKDREFKRLKTGTARAGLVMFGLSGLALAAAVSLCAQEAPATSSSSGQVVTAYLDYQDANYRPMSCSVPMVLKSSAFKKEPALSRGKVIRGTLRLDLPGSEEVAFAWDRGARKLYLDLNRNLDLTDDGGGVLSPGRSYGDNYQTFANIRLPMKTAAGSRQMLLDLNVYDYGSRPGCSAAMGSFWQGRVTLQGKDWQVGLLGARLDQGVSVEGGQLLLRPWSARTKPFSVGDGSLAAFPFSPELYFNNRAYQVHCNNEVQGGSVKMRMQFAEQRPALGDLKITGQFVERVTLGIGPYMVVLDHPEGMVKVPTGSYAPAKVWLKKGEMEAQLDERMQQSAGRITVNEKRPAVLTAGGPLTNSVSISRRGKNLSLNYQLVGVGGAYQLMNQDRSHPPEFTIYQGDKKAASGKFEFG